MKNRYIAPSQIFKLKDIVDDVRERFGVQISYNKAWRAREATYDTLQVTPKESYSYLPAFLHILVECNPGTTTNLVVTAEGRFNYCFFAFIVGLSILCGWGTFKGKIQENDVHCSV